MCNKQECTASEQPCAGCDLMYGRKKISPQPHKHAAVIKAWADGAKIQCRPKPVGRFESDWKDVPRLEMLLWLEHIEYRVKPEPKPDVVISANISKRHIVDICVQYSLPHNVKFIWDGETGQLKSVEKI